MSTKTLFRTLAITALMLVFGIGVNASQTETEFKNKDDSKQIIVNASTGDLIEYLAPKKNTDKPVKKVQTSQRQKQQQKQTTTRRRSAHTEYENKIKRDVNQWTLGLAAGKLIGTPIHMASELASVIDDGKNLHVVPMITRGPSSNIHALLYMRGVDLAIVSADSLAEVKKQKNIPNLINRINYITQLYLSELHILARPEIKSIKDLKGKVVNFNTKGTAGAFSGPLIFKRLGLKVKESHIPNKLAMQKMKESNEISAIVFMTGKPITPLKYEKWPEGFHLLSLKYSAELTDYYVPTTLSSKDYPGLIPEGKQVLTVAVPSLLAVYNWKTTSKRYLKVERFIQYMLKRWKTFQKPPFHEKWRNINLNAKVPGWNRFPAMQEQLDLMTRLNRNTTIAANAGKENSDKKLKVAFDRFLRNYARANGLSGFTNQQREKLFRQFHKFWRDTGR